MTLRSSLSRMRFAQVNKVFNAIPNLDASALTV
jgi:hypothetical protein